MSCNPTVTVDIHCSRASEIFLHITVSDLNQAQRLERVKFIAATAGNRTALALQDSRGHIISTKQDVKNLSGKIIQYNGRSPVEKEETNLNRAGKDVKYRYPGTPR
jgi:hypothetical protein